MASIKDVRLGCLWQGRRRIVTFLECKSKTENIAIYISRIFLKPMEILAFPTMTIKDDLNNLYQAFANDIVHELEIVKVNIIMIANFGLCVDKKFKEHYWKGQIRLSLPFPLQFWSLVLVD